MDNIQGFEQHTV